MKKIFILAIAAISMATAANAQFRLGPTVGLNLSNQLIKDNDNTYSDDFSNKLGFSFGVVAEYAIGDNFAISPELLYAQKGHQIKASDEASDDFEGYTGDAKMKTNLNYFVLPINAVGIFPINDDFKISVFAGPYFGYAFSGKEKLTGLTDEEEAYAKLAEALSGEKILENDLEIGSDEKDDYKAFDLGLSFGVGAEYKGFFLKGQYNLGLANLSNYTDNGAKINNRNIGISVGYLFNLQ